ncbi:MAG: hypothetical protein O7E57_11385, partial [Gammaproteobacteria bacterium]|nr:hypothetical protein [Gammaproteobacteria bacterium]
MKARLYLILTLVCAAAFISTQPANAILYDWSGTYPGDADHPAYDGEPMGRETLNDWITVEGVQAEVKNGVLELVVPGTDVGIFYNGPVEKVPDASKLTDYVIEARARKIGDASKY